MLQVCAHRTRYPDPDLCLPARAKEAYTDAAGGTSLTLGAGCGAILDGWWSYIAWSSFINGEGTARGGRRVRNKLSALELVGPLHIVSGAYSDIRGKPLRIYVDNGGSVEIWKKGYSTSCELSTFW